MNRFPFYIILFIITISFFPKKGVAQKTDTIVHINGNWLTGDLKKIIYGVATWKMDGMGTINVEEVKINTIRSNKMFEVKMKNGLIYFGSFDTSSVDRKVYVIAGSTKILLNIDDIVEVYPIKRNFWTRTSGKFSLGINASKGSDIVTSAFTTNLNYRKKKTYFQFSFNSNNTFQGDSLSASKIDAGLSWQRTIKKNWSTALAVSLSQNTELGTKLRTNIGALGLRDISYNIWNRLYAGAGLTVAREIPYGDNEITTDLVGIVTVAWKVYRYKSPKVSLDANVDFIPYLTGENRFRTSLNLNPSISILNDDFKIGITFYYNYDSRPTGDASSTDDYGINLQFTYFFH